MGALHFSEKIDRIRIFYVLYYLEDLIKASGNLIFPTKFYTIYVAAQLSRVLVRNTSIGLIFFVNPRKTKKSLQRQKHTVLQCTWNFLFHYFQIQMSFFYISRKIRLIHRLAFCNHCQTHILISPMFLISFSPCFCHFSIQYSCHGIAWFCSMR